MCIHNIQKGLHTKNVKISSSTTQDLDNSWIRNPITSKKSTLVWMHYGVVQLQIINRELPTLQNEPTNCKIEMFFMLQECADLCKPLAQFRPQERKSIPTHDLSESVLSVFMLFPLLPHRTISASVIFDPDHVFIHFFSHLFFFFFPPGFPDCFPIVLFYLYSPSFFFWP